MQNYFHFSLLKAPALIHLQTQNLFMNFLHQVHNMAMDIVSKLCLIFMFALTDCKKGF